jgi:DNA-binding MarR family transcriptional regulator
MASSSKRTPTTADPTGEFPFDVVTYLFHLFAVLGRHREAALEGAFRPLGLNVARYRALSVVARLEPLGMSELADFSAVDRTTMTRTVDQLVTAGFVLRETPPTDRRQVLLRVTPAGRGANQQALRAVYQINRRALDGFDEQSQRQFARLEQRMVANLVPDPALTRRLLEHTRDDDR